jgi:hypothetical protein
MSPYSYDFFVAPLTCPRCGATSPADESTNMQTYLRDNPSRALLGVGDALPLDPDRIRRDDYEGYRAIRAPTPGEPIRILQSWECPACEQPLNWAEIDVRNGVIHGINAVPLDRAHFERSHLISNDVISVASDLTGKPPVELLKDDLIQILRDKL